MNKTYNIISLGAGVQSSAMALLAEKGELPPVDFAVFTDTGDEPDSVYQWLDKLEKMLSFPVIRTASHYGRLSDNLFKWGFSQIPCWSLNDKGQPGLGRRQCTRYWKIRPVNKAIRQHTDTFRKRVEPGSFKVWKGISIDEADRAKPDQEKCNEAIHPLLGLGLTRQACADLVEDVTGERPPKSACYYCPYQRKDQWEDKYNSRYWPKILDIDAQLNARGEFLHPSCRPIKELPWRKEDDKEPSKFSNECEGMCGL